MSVLQGVVGNLELDDGEIFRKCYHTDNKVERICYTTAKTWLTRWNWVHGWCRNHSAFLTSIDGQHTQTIVEKYLTDAGLANNIWLGATFHDGDWQWVGEAEYTGKD